MIKTRFPFWYPFQEIEAMDFRVDKIEEIEGLIEERKNLYNSDEDYKFKRNSWETEEEFIERISIDRKAYTIIKMGVANDPKLSAWFVEVEGDLFQRRFAKSEWKIKKQLLNDLFPQDQFFRNWMNLDELSMHLDVDIAEEFNIPSEEIRLGLQNRSRFSQYKSAGYGMHKIIGINFRYATYRVRTRKSRIFKGWVIDSVEKLLSTVKKQYEQRMRDELDEYGHRIETEAPGPIKRLAEDINSRLRKLVRVRQDLDFSNFEFEGSYEDNLILFPPCIQDLMIQMKEVGYLKHHNRFQLGLFLKHTGMNVDEQMEYWFNFAVDNIDITFEQFEKNVGYTIRHLYGLEGKKADYQMMSCGTIQSSGHYHCRFQDMSLDKIKERIQQYIISLPGQQQAQKAKMFKEELDPLIGQGKPSEACAKNLQLTLGPITERIHHPLHYLDMAAEVSDKVTKKDEESIELETSQGENE